MDPLLKTTARALDFSQTLKSCVVRRKGSTDWAQEEEKEEEKKKKKRKQRALAFDLLADLEELRCVEHRAKGAQIGPKRGSKVPRSTFRAQQRGNR